LDRKTLIAGGVAAVMTIFAGQEALKINDRNQAIAEFHQDQMTEVSKRKVGEEIKSMRTSNSETFKSDSVIVTRPDGEKVKVAQFNSRLYSGNHFWKDADVDTLRPLDLTVRDISALARMNPLRTHDKYVDAGPYTATWMNDKPNDYRIDAGDIYIKYRALFDEPGISATKEPTAGGIKETVILADSTVGHSLKWIFETDGSVVPDATNGFDVRAKNGNVPLKIEPPVASDARENPVMAVASVSGDTLTFRVTVLPGQEYPITVDPSTTVVTATSVYNPYKVSDSWAGARDATTAGGDGSSPYTVGSSDSWMSARLLMRFPLPAMASCSACTLWAYQNDIEGAGDSLYVFSAHSFGSTNTSADFINFNGWVSGSAHNGTALSAPKPFPAAPGLFSMIFNAAGIDSVMISTNDTLRLVLIDARDYRNVAPEAGASFENRISGSPYIGFTYTLPPPVLATNVTVMSIDKSDSLLVSWGGTTSSNDSLILRTYPDSVFIAYLVKSNTSQRIGNLNPYTKYKWYIKSKTGGGALYSNADSGYTLQTFKTENFSLSNTGYAQNKSTAVYDSARGETLSDSLSSGSSYLGQWWYSSSVRYVLRHFQSVALPKLTKVKAESLFIYGTSDSSYTDFNIEARAGTWTGATAANLKYNLFDGWQTAMTAYTGTQLITPFSTAGFTTGATLNKLVFTAAGRDSTYKHGVAPDTLRFMLLSSRDISATAPVQGEYIEMTEGSSYLRLTYAPPDSAPNGLTITSISKDSLLATWTDRSYSERGFIVVDASTGNIIAGTDTTNQDVTSKRVGGLLPNTSYTWKVKAVGGGANGLLSAADSCYTRAATLPKPTVTMVTDSTRKVVIDTSGIYTSFTRLAIQDSITGKFVDWISGALDTLAAGTDSSNADYRTYANWNGALGDTVKYEVGKTSAFRTWTRSAQ